MLEVSLQLLCTSKSGTLSRLIREINQFGLQYRNHQIETDASQSRITINAAGELNCSRDALEQMFLNFPEVLQVLNLSLARDGRQVSQSRAGVSRIHLSADEQLTPAVIRAAEQRLSDILGPVASVIVESVAGDCADAGELYRRLAEELNDEEERRQFLSVIDPKKLS